MQLKEPRRLLRARPGLIKNWYLICVGESQRLEAIYKQVNEKFSEFKNGDIGMAKKVCRQDSKKRAVEFRQALDIIML